MRFDGSLLFLFENRTRREERHWNSKDEIKKSKWNDEENGKADNPVGNFDGFCLFFRGADSVWQGSRSFSGDGPQIWDFSESRKIQSQCGTDQECRKPSEPSYFPPLSPIFMLIQLHSKDFPHELVGGWQRWFPRCKHAYTACFFVFLHNIVLCLTGTLSYPVLLWAVCRQLFQCIISSTFRLNLQLYRFKSQFLISLPLCSWIFIPVYLSH